MTYDIIVTIFGSTGDLTARKLLPALWFLSVHENISLKVFAVGRREYSTSEYIDAMHQKTPFDTPNSFDFVEYVKMQIDDPTQYDALKEKIENSSHQETIRLFYLAVGPELFETISMSLSQSKLVMKDFDQHRIIFEKPFGENLNSAKRINALLWQFFTEKQIYRIDHYLGKEMIQNIMMLRFANRVLEDSWQNNSIASMKIYVKEQNGILSRAGYYDKAGALRDMVQSHVLQIVSLLTMEPPITYFSEDVKDQKVRALHHLDVDLNHVIMGQYEGYLEEANISNDSTTETFVALKMTTKLNYLKGVPIYVLTGKKLDEKAAYIEIEFKETSEQHKWHLPLSKNRLVINISPKDGFKLIVNAKVPGLRESVQAIDLGYTMNANHVGNLPEAYEKLFSDVMKGSKSLFTRWDEIEASWSIVDQILESQYELFKYQDYNDLKEKLKTVYKEDFS